MSLVKLKNEFTEDIQACRSCLATNTKLRILQDELSEAYKNLCGIDVSPYDTLPPYICDDCSNLLIKYRGFRDVCHQARRYLEKAQMRKIIITIEYLNNFQPQQYKNPATNSNIPNNGNTATSLKVDTDHHFDHNVDEYNHQHIDLSPDSDNMSIYTDTIKTETPESKVTNVHKKHSILRKKTKKNDSNNKRGKYFETEDNISDFEKAHDVTIAVLSREQQMKDVLERKLGLNYLHSPYKCELCYKGYMGPDLLKKHFISQHDPSRGDIVCEFCQFRYKDRRGLTQHLKSHRLKFACKQCSYVSRTTFNAKEHFKMHSGRVHECRHCGKSYEKLSSHLSHLRLQHPSEFIWCDLCGEAFIGTFGLNAHKKRAHRHLPLPSRCPLCDKCFAHTTALERHSTHDSCDGHSCVRCGDIFKQALELRDHLLEKHRSCKVFACEKCDKTFSRESLYSAHYRRIHVDSEDKDIRRKERPWICEVCGKTLPNKCVLLYHQRNHTGEKPYSCAQCPKRFTMRKLLQSHLRVHTKDRPYTCKICPKAFKGLSALRAHEHIHTGHRKVSPKNRIT